MDQSQKNFYQGSGVSGGSAAGASPGVRAQDNSGPSLAEIAKRARCISGCGTPVLCVCAYLEDASAELARLTDENKALLAALRRLRNAISDYGGHGNPGCPDRAEGLLALQEADAAIDAARNGGTET